MNSNYRTSIEGKRLRVLVVDKCKLNRVRRMELGRDLGAIVATVEKGKHVANKSLDDLAHFNLFLFDTTSRDSFLAIKELRAKGVTAMIVGVIIKNDKNEEKRFLEAGANECLEKPLLSWKLNLIFDRLKNEMM